MLQKQLLYRPKPREQLTVDTLSCDSVSLCTSEHATLEPRGAERVVRGSASGLLVTHDDQDFTNSCCTAAPALACRAVEKVDSPGVLLFGTVGLACPQCRG